MKDEAKTSRFVNLSAVFHLSADIKFHLLEPRTQLVRLDPQGRALESDDRLFALHLMSQDPVYDRFPVLSGLQSQVLELEEGGSLWQFRVVADLRGREEEFDFAFCRMNGWTYWLILVLDPSTGASTARPSATGPALPLGKEAYPCILVAEDNPFNQKVVQRQLDRLGFASVAVGNGLEALEALGQRHFSLVLMDLNMPVLNGYDAFRQIRAILSPPASTIPIVAMSSSGLTSDDPGFDAVLRKPVQTELLRQTINSLLRKEGPHTGPSAGETLVRLDYLKEVTQANHTMMVELVDIYLKEVPVALAQMQAQVRGEEWWELRESAHKTKANFRYVGADRMFHLADTIERYAAGGRLVDRIPDLLSRLLSLAEPTADALRKARALLLESG